ncbi:MAG: YCF48-related protein [Steroidobacteraceae bacterium]|jgi:photosystem II stability/assembly factor-like uncharacterized protein|nr:YCF48-related protein [Steroidobacteraceae bacterium]
MPFPSRVPTTLLAALFGASLVATSARVVVAPLAVRSLLLDVQAVPGANGRLVAVGERGHVLVSTDGGTTWRQSRVPTRATLTGVYFADVRNGWAVGHDEVILRTTDGGATWTRVRYEPDREQPLLDVWFADANVGLAVGAFATIYRTADGGATWEPAEFAPAPVAGAAARATPGTPDEDLDAMAEDEEVTEPHLNAVAASSTGKLYLAAEAGNLYRSDDAGATWTQLASPYEGSFFGVLPLDGDVVLAFGLRGHLFRSEDAGASWTRLESGSESLLAGGARLADGTIVIVGLAGTVLVSTDGGRTFERRQQPDRRGFAAAAPGRAGAVLVGESGVRELSVAQLTGRAQS